MTLWIGLRRSLTCVVLTIVQLPLLYGQSISTPVKIAIEGVEITRETEKARDNYLACFWAGDLGGKASAVFTHPLVSVGDKNIINGFDSREDIGNNDFRYGRYLYHSKLQNEANEQQWEITAKTAQEATTDHGNDAAFCKLEDLIDIKTPYWNRDNIYYFAPGQSWIFRCDQDEYGDCLAASRSDIQNIDNAKEPLLRFRSFQQMLEVLRSENVTIGLAQHHDKLFTGRIYLELHHETTKGIKTSDLPRLIAVSGNTTIQDRILVWWSGQTDRQDVPQTLRFLWLPKGPQDGAFQFKEGTKTDSIELNRFLRMTQRAFVPQSESTVPAFKNVYENFQKPSVNVFSKDTRWASFTELYKAVYAAKAVNQDAFLAPPKDWTWTPRNRFQSEYFDVAPSVAGARTGQLDLAVPGPAEVNFNFAANPEKIKMNDGPNKPRPIFGQTLLFPKSIYGSDTIDTDGKIAKRVGSGFVFHLIGGPESDHRSYIQSRELTVESFLRSQGLPENSKEDWAKAQLFPDADGQKTQPAEQFDSTDQQQEQLNKNAAKSPVKLAAWNTINSHWVSSLDKENDQNTSWPDWLSRERVYAASLLKPTREFVGADGYEPSRIFAKLQLNSFQTYSNSRIFAKIDEHQWHVHRGRDLFSSDPGQELWSFRSISEDVAREVDWVTFENDRQYYTVGRSQRLGQLKNGFQKHHVDPMNEPVVLVAPLHKERLDHDGKLLDAELGATLQNTAHRIIAYKYSGNEKVNAFLRLPTRVELQNALDGENFVSASRNWPDSIQDDHSVRSSPLVSEWACDVVDEKTRYYVIGLNRWSDLPCLKVDLLKGIEINCAEGKPPEFVSPVISLRWVIEVDPKKEGDQPGSEAPAAAPSEAAPTTTCVATEAREPAAKTSAKDALDTELNEYLEDIFGDGKLGEAGLAVIPSHHIVKKSIEENYGIHPYWKIQYLRYLVFSGHWGPRRAIPAGQDNPVVPHDNLTDCQILQELRILFPSKRDPSECKPIALTAND